ncbi:MAG: Hint domain-containing protein, partial [Caulobacteraceae bacterium]
MTSEGMGRPIIWVGSKHVERPSRPQWPVRVLAGAFGDGLPKRDLWLSPGHAVCLNLIEEVFVPVGELVNGATIAQV